MQTLGLSDTTTRSESRLKSLFWPSIQSGADVDYLAVQGFWVCTIVGVISLLTLVFAGQPITGILVFLIFHLGGVGVREHNPFAAVIMLAYYVLDWLTAPRFSVIRIIFSALLVSNVRATWIAGAWKPDSEEAALPVRLADTFRQTGGQMAGLHLAQGESALLHLRAGISRRLCCRRHRDEA